MDATIMLILIHSCLWERAESKDLSRAIRAPVSDLGVNKLLALGWLEEGSKLHPSDACLLDLHYCSLWAWCLDRRHSHEDYPLFSLTSLVSLSLELTLLLFQWCLPPETYVRNLHSTRIRLTSTCGCCKCQTKELHCWRHGSRPEQGSSRILLIQTRHNVQTYTVVAGEPVPCRLAQAGEEWQVPSPAVTSETLTTSSHSLSSSAHGLRRSRKVGFAGSIDCLGDTHWGRRMSVKRGVSFKGAPVYGSKKANLYELIWDHDFQISLLSADPGSWIALGVAYVSLGSKDFLGLEGNSGPKFAQ
eukprot:212097-Amphidinium_carterae.1